MGTCAQVYMEEHMCPLSRAESVAVKHLPLIPSWDLQNGGKGREAKETVFHKHLLCARYFTCMSSL
jgi:hypothetical protein